MKTQKRKLLSIDDDPSFNLLLKKSVDSSYFDLVTTESVDAFLKEYLRSKPHLCMVDLNLSEKLGAGYKLLELIREKVDQKIPILVISKMAKEQNISYALELGASDFLPKPLDRTSLEKKLERLLNFSLDDSVQYPFFATSTTDKDCELDVGLYIKEVSEYGMLLHSTNHVSKGSSIYLKGRLIEEITARESLFVTVIKNSKGYKSDFFDIKVIFDTDDRQLLTRVRKWLANRT